MKATITNIKKFAVHDGDGIRTTVFLKGCPLKCVWCHNPESISFHKGLAYFAHKCAHCGRCEALCSANVFNGSHTFERTECVLCGECVKTCPNGAFELYGKEFTSDELLEILLEDKIFYDSSGGGITLSGGECLMQAEFCAELLKKCKAHGLHTAVDTCGYVSRKAFDLVIPYTDIFLYDIKAIDEDIHMKCTGQSNKIILENIKYLDERGCKIEVRVPYVPEWNDNQMERIAKFLIELHHVCRVRILPYHNYVDAKYEALGMKNTMPTVVPTKDDMEKVNQYFQSMT